MAARNALVIASGVIREMPAGDTLNGAAPAVLVVRDEKTSGTNGGTSTNNTWTTRTLNTVAYNGIAGASLNGSNEVVLPAGTYLFQATAPGGNVSTSMQLRLYNVTAAATAIAGDSMRVPNATIMNCNLIGAVTLAVQSNVRLETWVSSGITNTGLGQASGSGITEVYAQMTITKLG